MLRRSWVRVCGRIGRPLWTALLASGVLLGLSQPAVAAPLQVTPGGATFPQRALIVSGPGLGSLSARRIHIVENGVAVRDASVRSLRQPSPRDFGVVLVIDVSPSAAAIEAAVAAARDIASQRPPEEELGIVEADATPPVALGLTRDPLAIQRALATPPTIAQHGETMYEAALTAVGLLANAKIGAGSVMVLSDGADQGTPLALSQLLSAAASAHVRLFGVGIRSDRFNPNALEEMARLGDGQFYAGQSSQLRQIFDTIEARLESQYLIRYYSLQGPGKTIAASLHIDGIPGTYDISYSSPALTTATFSHAKPPAAFWNSTAAFLAIAGTSAFLLAFGVWVLFWRANRRAPVTTRVGAFLPARPSHPRAAAPETADVTRLMYETTQRALERTRWWLHFREEVEIAQIEHSPIEIVFITLAAALLVAVVLYELTGTLVTAALPLIVAPVLMRLLVHSRLRKQQTLFGEQLAEHLQEIAAAMRAGRSLVDSFALVTEASSEPTRREFELALADERLGMPLEEALGRIIQRMENKSMAQVALVAAVQRRTGGNMAEVLDQIAETVRETAEIRRELRALTAQARMSRWVLTVLPAFLLAVISVTDPKFERPMFHTAFGIMLLVVSTIMVTTGSLIMSRLVKVDL